MIYYSDICNMYITLKFDYYKQKSNCVPTGLIIYNNIYKYIIIYITYNDK